MKENPDSDTLDLDISDSLQQDNLHTDQDKLEEIVQAYQEAIKLNPDDADSYYGLGNAYRYQEELAEATQAYQEAVKLNPNYIDAYNNLGVTLKEQGRLGLSLTAS